MRIIPVIFIAFCCCGLWAGPMVMKQKYETPDLAVCGYSLKADTAGRADATAALQSVIDRAAADGGGVVWCPAGTYRFDGHITLRKGVTLRGDWRSPRETGGRTVGTIFAVYESRGNEKASPFITMEKVSGVTNLSFWYPEQDPENIVPYPWTLSTVDHSSCGYLVRNVSFVNSYKALSNGADDHQCYNVAFYSGLYGCPLKYGIWLDWVLDITRLEHIYFGPSWWEKSGLEGAPVSQRASAALRKHMLGNTYAISVCRFDWMPLYDVEIDGCHTGLDFISNDNGCANGNMYDVRITNCRTGINAAALALYGWTITNCHIDCAPGEDNAAVRIRSSAENGPLMFHSCTLGRIAAEKDSRAAVSLVSCRLKSGALIEGGDFFAAACQSGGQIVLDNPGWDNAADSSLEIKGTARPIGKYNVPEVHNGHQSAPFFRPKSSRVYCVADFGALGDEKTDDTAAFEAALAASAKTGGTVYVPAGRYIITRPLSIPTGTELRGINEGPAHTMVPCSALLVKWGRGQENNAFIKMQQGSSVRGLCFWYPEHRAEKLTPWAWTIRALGRSCQVRDVSLGNSWQGLDFASAADTGGHVISGVMGCTLRRGIFVSNAPGGGTVENCQLVVHYWDRNDSELLHEGVRLTGLHPDINNALRRQSESFVFTDCKNEHILSTFSFASQKGLTLGRGFEGTVINHGSDGTVFGINIEGNARARLINTLAAPVPSMHLYPGAEYMPLDPANTLYVNKSSRSITAAPDFTGSAELINTAVWGYGDTILAEGTGSLDVQLINTLLGLGVLRSSGVSLLGAYSRYGTLWSFQGEGNPDKICAFGQYMAAKGENSTNLAAEAAISVSSQVSEGQGANQLNDGFAASVFASKPGDSCEITLTLRKPARLTGLVLVNTDKEGGDYNTCDFDVYSVVSRGSLIKLAEVRDNHSSLVMVPLSEVHQQLMIKVLRPNRADRHTRIGEIVLLGTEL